MPIHPLNINQGKFLVDVDIGRRRIRFVRLFGAFIIFSFRVRVFTGLDVRLNLEHLVAALIQRGLEILPGPILDHASECLLLRSREKKVLVSSIRAFTECVHGEHDAQIVLGSECTQHLPDVVPLITTRYEDPGQRVEVELWQLAIARMEWIELEIEGDRDAFQYVAVGQDRLQDIA